jgi:hypothetical protein
MNKQYPNKFRVSFKAKDDSRQILQTMPKDEREQLRLIQGHVVFGIHDALHQPFIYTTMLREPISRVISEYYYQRDKYEGRDDLEISHQSLAQFAQNGVGAYYDNRQTRFLSGAGNDVEFNSLTNQHLDMAKQNLKDHFQTVGLTSRFDESVMLMAKAFGWTMPYYRKLKADRKRPDPQDISEDTLQVIRDHNLFDNELYGYASNLFDEMIQNDLRSIQRRVRMFRILNAFVPLGRALRAKAANAIRIRSVKA